MVVVGRPLTMGAAIAIDDGVEVDADGFPRAVNGRALPIPGRGAAIPVRPDHRGVHPRARPFPRGPLVRRDGQGLLDRLRQGDLRLYDRYGTRWRFAWVPLGGYVKFLDDENSASVPSRERSGTNDAGGARRSVPDQVIGRPVGDCCAGPIANFLLAIAIFTVSYTVWACM